MRPDYRDDLAETVVVLDDQDDEFDDQDDESVSAVGFAHWFASLQASVQNLQPPPEGHRHRRWIAAAGAAIISVSALVMISPEHSRQTPATASASGRVATGTAPRSAVTHVVGDTPGCGSNSAAAQRNSQTRPVTGVDAIAWFEAAYYVRRDGARARTVVSADAVISDARTIQAGIDSIPAGTLYCVHIRPLAAGLYAVELTETRPDGTSVSWSQHITTTEIDGRAMMTSITDG